MVKCILIVILLITCDVSNAQNISKPGSNISAQQAQEVLNHHNKVREKVGSPPLTWNKQLAAYAQQWAWVP